MIFSEPDFFTGCLLQLVDRTMVRDSTEDDSFLIYKTISGFFYDMNLPGPDNTSVVYATSKDLVLITFLFSLTSDSIKNASALQSEASIQSGCQ